MNGWMVATIVLAGLVVWMGLIIVDYEDLFYEFALDVEEYAVECEDAIDDCIDVATGWKDNYYACVEASYG